MKYYSNRVIILIVYIFAIHHNTVAKEIESNADSAAIRNKGSIFTEVTIPDKLNIILPEKYFEQKNDAFKDYLPAILTLIAGVLSVYANWIIAKKLRDNTTQNIEKQLSEAKRIKYLELQATINTRNRQEWMNQFRDAISEYISLITISIANIKADNARVFDTIKRLSELNSRLDLLLHPDRENEEEIMNCYAALVVLLLTPDKDKPSDYADQLSRNKERLIILSRAVLERNWQKLNNLDYLKGHE